MKQKLFLELKAAIVAGQNFLYESSEVGAEEIREVIGDRELVVESSLALLATFLCPDGAIMAQGVKCFPHCIAPMLEHPDKQFVLYLNYLDYSKMTNFEWLRSILNHQVNGREINNYVVVGRLHGDALNFDYDQVKALFN